MYPPLVAIASSTGQLKELTDIYGGGPLAGLVATFVVAIIALFFFLARSWSSHLRDARSFAALAEKMTTTVEGNTRVLHEASGVLRDASVLFRASTRAGGRQGSRKFGEEPKQSAPLKQPIDAGGGDGD